MCIVLCISNVGVKKPQSLYKEKLSWSVTGSIFIIIIIYMILNYFSSNASMWIMSDNLAITLQANHSAALPNVTTWL